MRRRLPYQTKLFPNTKSNKKKKKQRNTTIKKVTKEHESKSSMIQLQLEIVPDLIKGMKTQNKRVSSDKTISEQKKQPSMKQKFIDECLPPSPNENKQYIDQENLPVELRIPVDKQYLSKLPIFFCRYCGSTKQEGHIKKEMRERKNKPKTQLWMCKESSKKFIDDLNPFNYPLWICFFTSFSLAAGMTLEAIKNNLEMIAHEKAECISISISSIRRLLENIIKLVLEFEQWIEHPVKSDEWQIDELYVWMSKESSAVNVTHRRKAWLITVSAIESRFLLAVYYCDRRSCSNTLKALKIARSRAKYDPKVIRCDGLRSHEKAAKLLFPNAIVESKKKKDAFGLISLHERIHKTARLGALPKKRRFYSAKTATIYAEFCRIDYNFVRTNDAAEKTPAQRAGVDFGITNWRELIYYALRFHIRKQHIKERLKLKSKQKKKKGKSTK